MFPSTRPVDVSTECALCDALGLMHFLDFGIFAAFMAWYNALAGIADSRYVNYHS